MNDRAEQAFRDAFADHGAEDFEPLQPPRRRFDARWTLAAVVAVVALAIPGALFLGGRGADPDNPVVADPAPSTAVGSAQLSGLAEPEDGWKWVSRFDVAVQVPETWLYSNYSWMPWCLNGASEPRMPEGPYVDSPVGIVPLIGCGEMGPEFVRMHVGFGEPEPGMTTVKTPADGAAVYVVMEADPTGEDEKLAGEILSTATTFERDQAGCTPTGPITTREDRPEPWDLSTAEGVTSVGICRYVHGGRDGANLQGSRVVDGDEAVDLVASLAAAPEGVSGDPSECLEANAGRAGVVLRVVDDTGIHDVYLRADGCGNLGVDDGVTHRQLNESCRVVFREAPVTIDAVAGKEVADLCFPESAATDGPGEIEFTRPPGFDPPITRPTEPPEER